MKVGHVRDSHCGDYFEKRKSQQRNNSMYDTDDTEGGHIVPKAERMSHDVVAGRHEREARDDLGLGLWEKRRHGQKSLKAKGQYWHKFNDTST